MSDGRKPSERFVQAMEGYEMWRTAQPHVIAAFQEHERQIAELQAKVAELERAAAR